MKLIAGLGNPDVKYINTRHNTGFMVLDRILEKKNLKLQEKFKSFFAKDGDVLYLLPKTYMNLSGFAIVEAMNFYKLNIKDILIVYDDISLPLGTLRFRDKGSDGGHNGIKSIIQHLGTKNFDRLKIGIGPQPNIPSENYVLQNFPKDSLDTLKEVLDKSIESVKFYLQNGIEKTQNTYN